MKSLHSSSPTTPPASAKMPPQGLGLQLSGSSSASMARPQVLCQHHRKQLPRKPFLVWLLPREPLGSVTHRTQTLTTPSTSGVSGAPGHAGRTAAGAQRPRLSGQLCPATACARGSRSSSRPL